MGKKQIFGAFFGTRDNMNSSRSGFSGSIEKPPPPRATTCRSVAFTWSWNPSSRAPDATAQRTGPPRTGSILPETVAAGRVCLTDQERLVVSRGGRPVAQLLPLAPSVRGLRPFGLAAGSFTVPADFDTPLPDDVVRDFEG